VRWAYPNGGETLNCGATITLRWESPAVSDPVRLEYSTDGGKSWATIRDLVDGDEEHADTGSCPWVVPGVRTDKACFRATTLGDPSYTDTSDGLCAFEPLLVGDVNWDGCVNVADLLIVRNNLGKGSCK
jgi:hypothetical protein